MYLLYNHIKYLLLYVYKKLFFYISEYFTNLLCIIYISNNILFLFVFFFLLNKVLCYYITAKKLPKNEQSGNASTSGQGRRLVETEGQKAATGNCCK